MDLAAIEANVVTNNDKIQQNGQIVDAIVVDQKLTKEKNFSYATSANDKQWKLKYGVDSRLVKYIDGIELHMMEGVGSVQPNNSINSNSNYKVADLAIECRGGHENYGFGTAESNRLDQELVDFNNGSPRPVIVRYVYKLNTPLKEILDDLRTEAGVEEGQPFGDDFMFYAWMEDINNKVIHNTDATGVYQIQDIDGDGKVDGSRRYKSIYR